MTGGQILLMQISHFSVPDSPAKPTWTMLISVLVRFTIAVVNTMTKAACGGKSLFGLNIPVTVHREEK